MFKRDTGQFQADQQLDPETWVTVADLALHGFGKHEYSQDGQRHTVTLPDVIDGLCRELSEHVLLDDVGFPMVPRHVARDLFSARAERLQAQAEAEAQRRAKDKADAENGWPAQFRRRRELIDKRIAEIHAENPGLTNREAYDIMNHGGYNPPTTQIEMAMGISSGYLIRPSKED